jgi:hypothetical protein
MTLTFDEPSHKYFLDDLPAPGVNEILQDCGLVDTTWFKPEHAQRGKDIHREIEDFSLGKYECRFPDYAPYVERWAEFQQDSGFVAKEVERRTYHPLYRYCGTIDAYGDGVIVDIKTGGARSYYELQLIAYGLMLDKPRLLAVFLKPDKYTVKEYDYSNEEVWLSCVRLWKWKNVR